MCKEAPNVSDAAEASERKTGFVAENEPQKRRKTSADMPADVLCPEEEDSGCEESACSQEDSVDEDLERAVRRRIRAGMRKEIAEKDAKLKDIRDAFAMSSSRFSCSGSMKWNQLFSIFYKKKKAADGQDAETTQKILLPASASDLQELVDTCDAASFGMGKKEVTDESYRKAYKLDADQFAALFDIRQTGILHTVQKILAPNCESIIAEPYKLNIYQKGGFFKVHKDTPRGNDMFGSLVLCLPQSFRGGDLVVKHKENVCRYTPLESIDQEHSIQWMAFYSDCDHQVERVNSGTRVTLTYNLYKANANRASQEVGPIDDELHISTHRLISDQNLKCILGYPLDHVYVGDEPFQGRDLVVLNTLNSLVRKHDHVTVQKWLVVKVNESKGQASRERESEGQASSEQESEGQASKKFMYIAWEEFKGGECLEDNQLDEDYYKQSYKAKILPVTWVQEPTKFHFGNKVPTYDYDKEEPDLRERVKMSANTIYAAGCLLLHVKDGV